MRCMTSKRRLSGYVNAYVNHIEDDKGEDLHTHMYIETENPISGRLGKRSSQSSTRIWKKAKAGKEKKKAKPSSMTNEENHRHQCG